MTKLNKKKFAEGTAEATYLKSTYPRQLGENTQCRYWGVRGENMLGQILMEIRLDLVQADWDRAHRAGAANF